MCFVFECIIICLLRVVCVMIVKRRLRILVCLIVLFVVDSLIILWDWLRVCWRLFCLRCERNFVFWVWIMLIKVWWFGNSWLYGWCMICCCFLIVIIFWMVGCWRFGMKMVLWKLSRFWVLVILDLL